MHPPVSMISIPKPRNWFPEWRAFFRKDFGHSKSLDLKAFLLIDLLVSLILIPIAVLIAFW